MNLNLNIIFAVNQVGSTCIELILSLPGPFWYDSNALTC